ncbi:MAG: lytic transglycosylase domain-containing protein, partial [Pseudomonadota bacterium]
RQLAHALNLEQARRDGALVAEALDAGATGDWERAEAIAARSSDLVVRDIVLWRKLRAGAGTVEEYQSFVARRGTWPGQAPLAEAVLGFRPASPNYTPRPELSGTALRNWREFRKIWRSRDYEEAEKYLVKVSTSAAALGDPGRWADRRARLARRAAREGRARRAYRLATRSFTSARDGYNHADLQWIAGWVSLRKLRDAKTALRHFETFETLVETPISLGRAGYWVGRAHEAMGQTAEAHAAYARASVHQTSFYGQLAAAKIGAQGNAGLTRASLPDWRTTPETRTDVVRMAAIIHYAGQDRLAWESFSHLGRTIEGETGLGALAGLALDLGQEHLAVRVSKNAVRRGVLLPASYYPVTELSDYVTKVEPALAMSLARQETELNPRAVSRAGARGLMQLMPGTARKVAEWIGEPYEKARLTADWRYNARLGQTYLARRIRQFDGSYVMAAAAYNAGASRVDNWLLDYGNPLRGDVDIIDWMEMIPFSETRNYVQRVMEGLYVYRARLTGEAGPMTIESDLARGMLRPRPAPRGDAVPSFSGADGTQSPG